MILCDINIFIYAHREDAPNHLAFRRWLEETFQREQNFGISDLVLSGFLRVVTHPRIFNPPTPMEAALRFVDQLKTHPNAIPVYPGPKHWEIFIGLCKTAGVKGNLVADAYLAALAIESGCEWISTDRDYSRFPGLKWSHPLER